MDGEVGGGTGGLGEVRAGPGFQTRDLRAGDCRLGGN